MSVLFATNIADPHHWTINTCFGAFCNVRVHLVPYRYRTKLGAKRAELVQKFVPEVASEFFATNVPDAPHWTLSRCFGLFRTVWVHSGPFGCLTKLGAKRAELVQKFVPRSRVGIFCNERTRSMPLDPKLLFYCIFYRLVVFGTVSLLPKTRRKRGRTGVINAKLCAM